jgi:hypothetical protein
MGNNTTNNNIDDVDPSKTNQVSVFIQKQLNAGLSPNEISAQLKDSGVKDEDITNGFKVTQQQVMPSAPVVDGSSSNAPTVKRGRIKTGWLLFKQSLKVLKSDKMLVRYLIMSIIVSIGVTIVFGLIFLLGHKIFLTTRENAQNQNQLALKPLGLIPAFIYYIIAYFVINLYSAGLAANVLDLFHGTKQSYEVYMKMAWSKARPLFFFSVIEATVGLILRAIAERNKLIGLIVSRVLGLVWSLARIFVVPIIITSDEGPVQAVKDSSKLLIATWGENLIGRISLGGAIGLIYFFIIIPILAVLGGILIGFGGLVGGVIFVVIAVLSLLVFGIITSTASNILNVALFYYARTRKIPAAFDPDLINSIFIHKKNKLL